MRNQTLVMGIGDCAKLPYRVLERVADTFYIEASHPEGKCVPYGQRGIFLQLTLTAPDGLHFRSCSSRKELEKVKVAPDQAQCSSFYGYRVGAKG